MPVLLLLSHGWILSKDTCWRFDAMAHWALHEGFEPSDRFPNSDAGEDQTRLGYRVFQLERRHGVLCL